jgi:pimeloyl-ACP methyl ester carboxylesterase
MAGESRVVMKSGFELTGQIGLKDGRVEVSSGPRTVFFAQKQLLTPEELPPAPPPPRFTLTQPIGRSDVIPNLTRPIKSTPFDAWGRRTLTVLDHLGKQQVLIQGISDLYPTHAVVKITKNGWVNNVWLSQIPSEQLIPILAKVTDRSKVPSLVKMIQFLVEAERFPEAAVEVETLRKLPGGSQRASELTGLLESTLAARGVEGLERAFEIGQFQRVERLLVDLDKLRVSDPVSVRIAEVRRKLKDQRERLQKAAATLKLLENHDVAPTERELVKSALAEITAGLSPATLDRLAPLLALQDQKEIEANEELALTLSGWALGDRLATKSLSDAFKHWRTRQRVLEAMEAEPGDPWDIALDRLSQLKANPLDLPPMIRLLPRPADSATPLPTPAAPAAKPGDPPKEAVPNPVGKVACPTKDDPHLAFLVVTPPEYDPARTYPAVVAVPGFETRPERMVELWKANCGEHGYLLFVPIFRPDATSPYAFAVEDHQRFLRVLAEIRHRYPVDADRVFLTGHETGAIQAWDLGLSHPDEFAGLIPFCGPPQFYAQHYHPNVGHLPVYAVEGQANGDNPFLITAQMKRYFAAGADAIFVEYAGSGREYFTGEQPTIFRWMKTKKRPTAPAKFSAVSGRPSEERFYWVRCDRWMPNATVAPAFFGSKDSKFSPAKIEAKATDAGELDVIATGLEALTVLMPVGLVPFDSPALVIRANRKVVHKGPVEPRAAVLLDHLRRTGDRQRLIGAEIPVPRL